MKGIILAGGSGTRLYPITMGTSKQLLPIYDKPMIYYPISILIMSGIKDILIITTPDDQPNFKKLLGDGSQLGIKFTYAAQQNPNGIAEAFIIGEQFLGGDSVCLILGDNVFYGHGLYQQLATAKNIADTDNKAVIFGYNVLDPHRYGIVEIDEMGNAISIEEKPQDPKSDLAVVGLYFYPNSVVNIAKTIQPSERGELEITDINNHYLNNKQLKVQMLKRGYIWLDAGTHDSLIDGGNLIKAIEQRQGFKIACLEEQALVQGFITKEQAIQLGNKYKKTGYGQYILKRANAL